MYCCLHLFFRAGYNLYVCDYNNNSGMYVCMVITYSKGDDQPDKAANPTRGQLAEQGKWNIPCPRSRLRILSREKGSAVPSRVSLLISILNQVLTYGIPPEFRGGVNLLSVHLMYHHISSTVIMLRQFGQ